MGHLRHLEPYAASGMAHARDAPRHLALTLFRDSGPHSISQAVSASPSSDYIEYLHCVDFLVFQDSRQHVCSGALIEFTFWA